MRLTRLIVVSMLFGSVFAACGDDGGSTPIDAPIVVVDAPPDAPAVLPPTARPLPEEASDPIMA